MKIFQTKIIGQRTRGSWGVEWKPFSWKLEHMISLKRNSKKELVPATGLRTRSSSVYSPNQKEDFKISRSKFNDFLTCQRCFYFDRVKGVVSPSTPGWTLNETMAVPVLPFFKIHISSPSTRPLPWIQRLVQCWLTNLQFALKKYSNTWERHLRKMMRCDRSVISQLN